MFIAITNKGQEFLYRSSSRLAVSKASAQKIADALTEVNYYLNEGQKWHVYDDPFYEREGYLYGKARVYKGNVKVSREYGFCKG
jgi:hypothetical protein